MENLADTVILENLAEGRQGEKSLLFHSEDKGTQGVHGKHLLIENTSLDGKYSDNAGTIND